jgi:hypothetical protein
VRKPKPGDRRLLEQEAVACPGCRLREMLLESHSPIHAKAGKCHACDDTGVVWHDIGVKQ